MDTRNQLATLYWYDDVALHPRVSISLLRCLSGRGWHFGFPSLLRPAVAERVKAIIEVPVERFPVAIAVVYAVERQPVTGACAGDHALTAGISAIRVV